MTIIVGGHETGLLDTSLATLKRGDRIKNGDPGHGEQLYVNVSNGNVVLQHQDAYMPSFGEDYALVRTYNSRGTFIDDIHEHEDARWYWSTSIQGRIRYDANGKYFNVQYGDGSIFEYRLNSATGLYEAVDGAGAYETLEDLGDHGPGNPSFIVTRANQTKLTFDSLGFLLSSVDTNGVTTTFTYNADRVVQIADDTGHVLNYEYENGVLVRVTDENEGVLVQYNYTSGLLSEVIDRMGHSTKYFYTQDGYLERVELPSVAVDAANGEESTDVREYTFVYDTYNWRGGTKALAKVVTDIIDASGNTTHFDYAFNLVTPGTSSTSPGKGRGQFDNPGDPNYTVDRFFEGGSTTVTGPDGQTLSYSYDAKGNLTDVVDQLGFQTVYVYDDSENVIAMTDRNGWGATHSDSDYYRTLRAELGYVDIAGEGKLAATLTQEEFDALTEAFTSHYEYDDRGNLISSTDNNDNISTFVYTTFNKLDHSISAMGHALTTRDDDFYAQKRVELGYAALVADLSAADIQAILDLHTTTFSYDANQNLIETVDAGGDITRFEYDANGNLTKQTVFLDAADLVDSAKQQVTQFIYDAFGNNIETIDAEGVHTFAEFDHFGNLTKTIDGNGGETLFTYDNDNRLLSVTDPEGHTTINTYDTVGNRVSVTDAKGKTIIRIFDRNNQLIQTLDPSSDGLSDRVTTFEYDVAGNNTATTDAEGRRTEYVYNERRQLVETVSALVKAEDGVTLTQYHSSFAYDGEGNRITTTNNRGFTTEVMYDQNGLIKQQTDPNGHITRFDYDANNNQVRITAGVQLPEARRQILQFSFDEEDQLIRQIDAEGNVTTFNYDAPGNQIAITDANGNTTDFEFDKNNRLVREIRPEVVNPATGLPERYTVEHIYDANGNEIVTIDENGHSTKFYFDKDNQVVLVADGNGINTVFSYDENHNRTSVQIGVDASYDAVTQSVAVADVTDAQVTTFAYNEFNELVSQTDGIGNALANSDSLLYQTMRVELGYAALVADLTAADQDALRALYTQTFTYDRVGNLLTQTDNLGRTTESIYDALNRVVSQIEAKGTTEERATQFRYDGNDNLVEQIDPLNRSTFNTFDEMDRVDDTTDAVGVVTQNTYDDFSNLISQTQAFGTVDVRTTQYEYDLNNRLIKQTDPEQHNQSFEYDAVGNRIRVVDGRNNPTEYIYDALNRNIKILDPLTFETNIEYDGVGNQISLIDARGGIGRLDYDAGNRMIRSTDAEGRVTEFKYDVRGNQIEVKSAVGTSGPGSLGEEIIRFEYDAENNLRKVTNAEGDVSTSDFDRVYNQIETVDGNGNVTLTEFDALNRSIRITDAEGGVTELVYDAVDNLLSRTDALGRLTSFVYDDNNRVITKTAADGVETVFAYDSVGNRVSVTRASNTSDAVTETFTYDKDNLLVSQTDGLGNVTSYENDENHNLIRVIDPNGHETINTYDAKNQLIRIQDPEGNIVQYAYDGNGNRTQVIDGRGYIITTYYNGNNEVAISVDAEGYATTFDYDQNGNVIAQTLHATPLSLPVDPEVLPVILADPANDQRVTFEYDKLNRLTARIDGEGFRAEYTYDAVGNRLTSTQFLDLAGTMENTANSFYDNLDRKVAIVSAEGYLTTMEYDAVGNQIKSTLYDQRVSLPVDGSEPVPRTGDIGRVTSSVYDLNNRVISQTSPLGIVTEYEYDNRGNQTAVINAAGTLDERRTEMFYDEANRQTDITNPIGVVTHNVYDNDGNVIARHDAYGTADERVTLFSYDGNHRLVQQTDPIGVVTTFEFDAAGNQISRTSAFGLSAERTETFEYDGNNRQVAAVNGEGERTEFVYDGAGNQIAVIQAPGLGEERTQQFEYDRDNRMVAELDGEGNRTEHIYDGADNRIRTTDAKGANTHLYFDQDNRLTHTLDAEGYFTTSIYDAAGNRVETHLYMTQYTGPVSELTPPDLTTLATADDQITSFVYDKGNRLLQTTNAEGGVSVFAYDNFDNRISSIDELGRLTTYSFDANDRLISQVTPDGLETQYTYDAVGNQLTITEAANTAVAKQSLFSYDLADRQISQTDPMGFVTQFEYDPIGNRTAVINAENHRTEFVYDKADRLVQQIDPLGGTTTNVYDEVGNQVQVIDARGNTTTYYYNDNGQVVFNIDAEGSVTAFEYDANQNQTVVRRYATLFTSTPDPSARPSILDTADDQVVYQAYDKLNRLSRAVDGEGAVVDIQYDGAGNVVATIAYANTIVVNPSLSLDSQTPLPNSEKDRVESFVFDRLNRQTKIIDAEGYNTTLSYDAVGNQLSKEFDELAQVTTFTYDNMGRIVSEVDSLNLEKVHEYDDFGNRVRTIEYFGTPDQRTWLYSYDANNRLVTETDPENYVKRNVYDRLGQILEEHMHDGTANTRTTLHSYDARGFVLQITNPDSTTVTYEYDANGNVTRQTDAANTTDARETVYTFDKVNRTTDQTIAPGTPSEITRHYQFDAFGNQVVEIRGFGTPDARRTDTLFDKNNRAITTIDGNGAAVNMTYDAFGNVKSRSITDRATGRTQTVNMEYEGRGYIIEETNGEGDIKRWEYDAGGAVTKEIHAADTEDQVVIEYQYDAGNRLTDKTIDPSGLIITTHFEYDNRNNIVSETNELGHVKTTEYDVMNRVLSQTDYEGFATSFTYDEFGNQTSITLGQYFGADPVKQALHNPVASRYVYDNMDRMLFEVDTTGIITKFAYDNRGNRIERIDVYGYLDAAAELDEVNFQTVSLANSGLHYTEQRQSLFEYDLVDRIVNETQPLGTVVHHEYNGAGELAAKVLDYGLGSENINATTAYYYNGAGQKEFEVDPVGNVTQFVYDDTGNMVRMITGLALDGSGLPSTSPTADARVTAYEYDRANRKSAEIVDPDGLNIRTSFEYDHRGNQITVIDNLGRRGEIAYDKNDKIVWQRDAEGYVTSYVNDARGNKLSETRYYTDGKSLALGEVPASHTKDQVSTFVYDDLDRLIEATDPRGIVNQLKYDALGNIVRDIQNATAAYDAPALVKEFSYNLANRVVEQVENKVADGEDPVGIEVRTTFEYDAAYNKIKQTVTNSWYDTVNLDAMGNPVARYNDIVTEYTVNLNNHITSETVDPSGLNLRTTYKLDALGNRIAETNANGYAAISEDSDWATRARRLLGIVDGNGGAIAAANLTQVQKDTILNAYTTRTYFDAASRPTFTVDPLGRVREAQFDSLGNLVKAIQYANTVDIATLDDLIPPAVAVDAAKDRYVEHLFNADGKEVSQKLAEDEYFVLNGTGYDAVYGRPEVQKDYDAVGNLFKETDGNGNATYFYYDSRGLMTGKVDAEGYLTVNEYDAFGNLVTESLYLDPQGLSDTQLLELDLKNYVPVNASNVQVTSHVYDPGNNEVKTILPPAELYVNGIEQVEALEIDRVVDAFGRVLTQSVLHRTSDTNPVEVTFTYDAAGRILSESDPRAIEIISSDDDYYVELRRDLGYQNADETGKLVADLTNEEKQAIIDSFATSYQYDAFNNLLVQTQGDRVTTFEFDSNNRAVRVHQPEYQTVDVAVDGTVLSPQTVNFVSDLAYDAMGNMLLETKANGDIIRNFYDEANQKIGSVDTNNTYIGYEYNFAGDRTQVRRYFNEITSVIDPIPVTNDAKDQVLIFDYDKLGRLIAETSAGDFRTSADDRVNVIGYDANGNQVKYVDQRGNTSYVLFDGMNRVKGTSNPTGALTHVAYNARGDSIENQAGGWNAPILLGDSVANQGVITQSIVTDEGIELKWSTDHATDALVYVRQAGSSDDFMEFGRENRFTRNHTVYVNGLEANTEYEYYVVSKDAFGYTLIAGANTTQDASGNVTVVNGAQSFTTATGVDGAVVSNLQPIAGGHSVDVNFALQGSAQDVSVVVGTLGSDLLTLENQAVFTPVLQGDGSYSVTLEMIPPVGETIPLSDFVFQIQWTNSQGQSVITVPQVVQQQQSLSKFDGTVSSVALGDNLYDMTVTWNLQEEKENNQIRSYFDTVSGETRYNVYVGYTVDGVENQEPFYIEADYDPENSTFTATFDDIGDTARTISLYYVDTAGQIVNAAPITVDTLVDLNQRYQRLALDFPNVETENAYLEFRYRVAGTSDPFTPVPDTAIHGLSVDVVGLSEGNYEYEADLVENGQVIRSSGGQFSLREQGSISDLVDAVSPTVPVNYTLVDNLLSLPDLLPLGTGESIVLEITDADAVTTQYPFDTAQLDLTQFDPGTYSLHVVKTLTETIDVQTTDPDTGETIITQEVVVTTQFDITGTITIGDITILDAESLSLSGLREMQTVNFSALEDVSVGTVVTGENNSTDHVFTYYDLNGRKIFSNENGGTWTRFFYDEQGNVTKEVRFKYQLEGETVFQETIVDPGTRPSLDHLINNYDAAVLARQSGQDTIRVITRTYDLAGNLLQETTHSGDRSDITNQWQYDRFNNKVSQTLYKGAVGHEETVVYEYNANNWVTRVTSSAFNYFDSFGNSYGDTDLIRTVTYDQKGNKTTETNERGYMERFHYDDAGRLIKQWDAALVDENGIPGASDLMTEMTYDHFDRMLTKTEYDLTGEAANASRHFEFQYDNFDQEVWRKDPAGNITTTSYDKSGNKKSETNAIGYALTDSDNEAVSNADWAKTLRERLGYATLVGDLSDDDKQAILARFTETYFYDAENRVVKRIDREGKAWRTSYDAYGNKVSESEPNGKVTRYVIGPYGKVTETFTEYTSTPVAVLQPDARLQKALDDLYASIDESDEDGWFTTYFQELEYNRLYGGFSHGISGGRTTNRMVNTFDWVGNVNAIQDDFGRNIQYTFNDADQMILLNDLATDKYTEYSYHLKGDRAAETMYESGAEALHIDYTYNERGWLTGVDSEFTFDSAGETVSTEVNVLYQYDQIGNRVRIDDHYYSFDGNNRMLSAYDPKGNEGAGETIENIVYDGYGNRVAESRSSTTTEYTYDLNNKVVQAQAVGSTDTEIWVYDVLGNLTFHRSANGDTTKNVFNGENRTIFTESITGGDKTISRLGYDASGRAGIARIIGEDFGFDEITFYDVRSKEHSKGVTNTWVNGARGLRGNTVFHRDANGNLTLLDRGRKDRSLEVSVAAFKYDNEGHIIYRSNREDNLGNNLLIRAFNTDPDVDGTEDGYYSFTTFTEQLQEEALFGKTSLDVNLNAYLYANGHPVAEGKTSQELSYVKLAASGGSTNVDDELGVIGYTINLIASDIVSDADTGVIDRTATATNIAERIYSGFTGLSDGARTRVVNYIEAKLPADDADIIVGAQLNISVYLMVLNAPIEAPSVVTDYSFIKIGEGAPGSTITSYVVRAGDTLRSIAAGIYGNPDYWFYIAEANGLSGGEELVEGTTLKIPNVVANSINNNESYKIYNESEIIGSTSPELKVIPKKKSFFQKLVTIIIIVIIIVVAYYVAEYAIGVMAEAYTAGAGIVANAIALSVAVVQVAAVGYLAGLATSFVTQGLAIAAGLQDEFDWKAMRDMGKDFAISAVAAGLGAWAQKAIDAGTLTQRLVQAGITAAEQWGKDGKITSATSILMALVPVKVDPKTQWGQFFEAINENKKLVSTGLSVVEKAVRDKDIGFADVASVALAAVEGSGVFNPNELKSGKVEFSWAKVGQQALTVSITGLIVGAVDGEEAGLNFIGSNLGSLLTSTITAKDYNKTLNDQIKLLTPGEISDIEHSNLTTNEKFGEIQQRAKDRIALIQSLAAINKELKNKAKSSLEKTESSTGTDEAKPTQGPAKPEVTKYNVQAKDNLWNIAKRQLGAGASNEEILRQTQLLVQSNPGIDFTNLQLNQEINLVEPGSGLEVRNDTVNAFNFADAKYQESLATRRQAAAQKAASTERAMTLDEIVAAGGIDLRAPISAAEESTGGTGSNIGANQAGTTAAVQAEAPKPKAPSAIDQSRKRTQEYWESAKDNAAQGEPSVIGFLSYLGADIMGKLGSVGHNVADLAVNAYENPGEAGEGALKSVANFGPELFNFATTAVKTSLNGYTLIAEASGLAPEGTFEGFRESEPLAIKPLFEYENKAQQGGALGFQLLLPVAASKFADTKLLGTAGRTKNASTVADEAATLGKVDNVVTEKLSSQTKNFDTGVAKFDTLFAKSDQFSKVNAGLNRRGVVLIDDASKLSKGERANVQYLNSGELAIVYDSKNTSFLDILHESRHVSQIQKAQKTGILGGRSPFSSQTRPLFERSAYEYELRLGQRYGFSESYKSTVNNILTSRKPGGEGYTQAFENRFFNLGDKTREYRLFETIEPRITKNRFFDN